MPHDRLRAYRDIAEQMLAVVEKGSCHIENDGDGFHVALVAERIFVSGKERQGYAFEQIGRAVQARIAFERARDMWTASGEPQGAVPLWLVTGSSVFASWLRWSRSTNAFRRSLGPLAEDYAAPVKGIFEPRARRTSGQGGAKVRVRFGEVVAESIEIKDEPRTIAAMGPSAHIRIISNPLPETVIAALADDPDRKDRRLITDVISNDFLNTTDLRIIAARNDGADAIFEIETSWGLLAPLPAAALAVVPQGADPAAPWRATADEVRMLDGLVDRARAHDET